MSKTTFLCDANPIDQLELESSPQGVRFEMRNNIGDLIEAFLSEPSVLKLVEFLIESKCVDTDFVLESIGQHIVEHWVSENNQCCGGAS